MIDIHSHILPGIDDGSKTVEETIQMAELAVSEGIARCIATPHHANGQYTNDKPDVLRRVQEINAVLSEKGIPLAVDAGQEIRVYGELIEDFHKAQDLLTLSGSRYMLIEFPARRIPDRIGELIHELRVEGITPVIAHPERNVALAEDPSLLAELIRLGALSQITSHSINGLFGRKLQQLCFDLCRSQLVHFIASDAHDVRLRPFGLKAAYDRVAAEIGSDVAGEYKNNAEKLVSNQPIHVREPVWNANKQGLFGKLLGTLIKH